MPSHVSLLLDPHRLMVAGSLVGRPRTTDDIVDHTGLPRKDVLVAVGDLRAGGLVETHGTAFSVPLDLLLDAAAERRAEPYPMDPFIGYGMTDDEQRVLRRFFAGRTLVEIPSGRSSRLIVLERLCLEFDIGQHYAERQVNAILEAFHPDTAALRRYLVDEDLLDRDTTSYWRSGGRVESRPTAANDDA